MAVRCLVAHEAEITCQLMSDILVKNGFEVVAELTSGDAVVAQYASLKPDILTLDLRMPERNGLSVLQEVLQLDPRARVLICSTLGEQSQAKQALSAGALEILVRPFDEDRVLNVIKKSLR